MISYSLLVMPTQLATESPTKMTSRRALEWMGMFNGLTGFTYEISDLFVHMRSRLLSSYHIKVLSEAPKKWSNMFADKTKSLLTIWIRFTATQGLQFVGVQDSYFKY